MKLHNKAEAVDVCVDSSHSSTSLGWTAFVGFKMFHHSAKKLHQFCWVGSKCTNPLWEEGWFEWRVKGVKMQNWRNSCWTREVTAKPPVCSSQHCCQITWRREITLITYVWCLLNREQNLVGFHVAAIVTPASQVVLHLFTPWSMSMWRVTLTNPSTSLTWQHAVNDPERFKRF